MPHVPPIPREELQQYEEVFGLMESAMGFVPSSLRTMAHVPAILDGFLGLVPGVMMNGLLPGELVNLISLVTSNASGCRYCQAHTGATAANQGTDAAKIAAAWEFETSDLFSDAERAALRVAFRAGVTPNAVTPEDFGELERHYSTEQIVAIVAVISLFGWLNRWNDTMATQLEDEPTAFASATLAANGWQVGKHA
ncbi:MAG: carboxymuconolactone decarboxylase family protein [Actinomycetota bacterium]